MMLSHKKLFFALLLVALSAFQQTSAVTHSVDVDRFLMEDGNHTDHGDMDHGECHCMSGDMLHCDDADMEADCHCHDGMLMCGDMMDSGEHDSHDSHDDHDHASDDSGATAWSLLGSAFAGAMVAATL